MIILKCQKVLNKFPYWTSKTSDSLPSTLSVKIQFEITEKTTFFAGFSWITTFLGLYFTYKALAFYNMWYNKKYEKFNELYN